MAKQNPQSRRAARAERAVTRRLTKMGLYDFSGVTEKDFPDFINIAEKINKNQTTLMDLSNDDLKTFIGFTMNSTPEMLTKLAEYGKKTGIQPDKVNEFVESMRTQLASPQYRQKLLQVSKEQDIKNKTAAFSNAVGVMLSGADMALSVKQLSEYNRQLKEQKRPTRPGPMQADPYLAAAKKAAEVGTYQEPIAAKAARQQAFDAYQQDLQNSAVASTGQAGAYGAQAQAAVTRLGRRGAEMAPQVEAFRTARQQQYGQMANLSAEENAKRYASLYAPYETDMVQYGREQASLAALGQAGRANLRTSMYDMGEYAPLLATPYVNRKYETLRAAMEARGMSPEQADKNARAGSQPPVSTPTQPPVINPSPSFQARYSDIATGPAYPTQALTNKYSIFNQVPSSSSFGVSPASPQVAAPPVIPQSPPIPLGSPSDIQPGVPYPTQPMPPQPAPRRDLMGAVPIPPSRMYPWNVNAPTYNIPPLPRRMNYPYGPLGY